MSQGRITARHTCLAWQTSAEECPRVRGWPSIQGSQLPPLLPRTPTLDLSVRVLVQLRPALIPSLDSYLWELDSSFFLGPPGYLCLIWPLWDLTLGSESWLLGPPQCSLQDRWYLSPSGGAALKTLAPTQKSWPQTSGPSASWPHPRLLPESKVWSWHRSSENREPKPRGRGRRGGGRGVRRCFKDRQQQDLSLRRGGCSGFFDQTLHEVTGCVWPT